MRSVRATIVVVEKQWVLHNLCVCVCVCVFLALGMQHAMRMRHIVICGLTRSTIFSILSHKRHDFRKKKLLNTKCVFWFSLQLLSESFLILRKIEWDMIKNVYGSSCKVPFYCPILMKLEFSRQIFEKSPDIKFNENPSSGSRVVPCGRTDGQTERS